MRKTYNLYNTHNIYPTYGLYSIHTTHKLCSINTIALPSLYFIIFIFFMFCITLSPTHIFAMETQNELPLYTNPDTGYAIYIEDKADLLTNAQEEALLTNMEAITVSGNVAFVSISENPYHDTNQYAKNYATTYFDSESGTVFLIDMDERYIWIYSTGKIYDVVTTAYANTITDNSYRYASDGDYFSCADTAFSQIRSLLEGYRIAQPMKYISNLLLALILSMLFNYFLVMTLSKAKKARNNQILDNIYTNVAVKNPSIKFLHQTRQYNPPPPPPSSGGGPRSRGGSRGGGGGSRGGGGGSRGGGGGHRF